MKKKYKVWFLGASKSVRKFFHDVSNASRVDRHDPNLPSLCDKTQMLSKFGMPEKDVKEPLRGKVEGITSKHAKGSQKHV